MPNADCRIIRSARRTRVALRVGDDGVLEVLVPLRFPERLIRQMIERESATIARLLARAARRPRPELRDGETFMLLGQPYPLRLTRRLRIFDHGFLIPDGDFDAKKTAMIELYRELAGIMIPQRVEFFQDICGIRPDKVQINSAATRWGSCSGKRTLSFSWKLIQCPRECVDYVVVHELSHLHEMNHSPAFWRRVAAVLPDYATRRRRLNEFARALPRW